MDFSFVNGTVIENTFWNFKGKVEYVDQWFLMKTPVPLIFLTLSYLLFVLKLGPTFMQTRRPFELSNIIIIYNIFQVVFSCFLLFTGFRLIWSYGLVSSTCLMETEDTKWTITSSTYYYFVAKVTELLDTVFFILKKKYRQASFLHIYHHFLMTWATWIALKYEPSYGTIFLGTLNSFVHIILYSYYAMSTFPDLAKYLWWKKYITIMQLLQFMAIILQVAASHVYSECPPSYTLLATVWFNATLFIYLFTKFYVNSYTDKNKNSKRNKTA